MLVGKARANEDTTGVREMIHAHGIKHPDIVFNQLCLESGRLNCSNCSWSNNNNPFGFFYKGKYLTFDNLKESIQYYKWWQDKLYRGGNYYEFLDRVGFATSKNYIKELKRMK